MKKSIKFILLSVFSVFLIFIFSFNTASAFFGLGGFFGGKIVNMKSIQIAALEMAGFQCMVLGRTITILPIGSPVGTPTEYFIPFSTISKTRYPINYSQLILGKYVGKSTITCILKTYPFTVTPVMLDIITIYGTSKM